MATRSIIRTELPQAAAQIAELVQDTQTDDFVRGFDVGLHIADHAGTDVTVEDVVVRLLESEDLTRESQAAAAFVIGAVYGALEVTTSKEAANV